MTAGSLRALDRMDESPLANAALSAALEIISGLAFVATSPPVEIVVANANGRAAYEANPPETIARVAAALTDSTTTGATVVPLECPAAPDRQHVLVVVPTGYSVRANLERASRLWRLTQRETEVLALLVHGSPNKEIAEALLCTVKTVEKHVSAVLAKARVRSRAAIPISVARL